MSGGGQFTVCTQIVDPENSSNPTTLNGSTPGEKEKILTIRFTDTGTGIKKEHLEQIFDPFFTTKPEDKGTGLGLSVCHSIIEKHGGILEAMSDGNNGTTFVIELPLNQKPEKEISKALLNQP
jgi:signal transduction histidine kinase